MDGEKPTRESLREVKREAKEREKAEKARAKAAEDYWRQQSGRKQGGSKGPAVGAVVGVVALLAAGGVAFVVLRGGVPGSSAAGTTSSPAPSSSTGPAASGSPSPGSTDAAELPEPEPFAGSPAEGWPVGAVGIKAPAATQVGVYRKAQVKDAYGQVTRYLVAATTDPSVTFRGKLDPVWATLPRESTAFLKTQRRLWDTSDGEKGITWDSLANRFYPKTWKAAAQVRVQSRFRTSIAKNGALRVHFVVVAAYWMAPREGGSGRTIVVRRTGDADFYGRGSTSAGPMYYGGSGYTSTASVCGAVNPHPDYLDAWPDEQAAPVVSPSSVVGTFDPSDPDAEEPDGCFVDTSGF